MARKRALITGVTGQDGSYLAEFLLDKGYEVHGIIRRASTFNTARVDHLYKDPHYQELSFLIHHGDLLSEGVLRQLLDKTKPDEVYNLGAQSHVRVSFSMPEYTSDIVGLGTVRLLEAIRAYQEATGKKVKFYQASSSEMFGATNPPQNELSPFYPRSPYAAAKAFAFYMTRNYREAYGMFAVNGILFNHESPRRGETFLTRKVTRGIASILSGREKKIYLGNLDARRDWGYAPEYVKAMWMMLQQAKPEDFVIGTGEAHSVKEFVEEAFKAVGITNWRKYVGFDERYLRPTEVNNLVADISKAKKKLKWQPHVGFKDLTRIMLKHDLALFGLHDEAAKIKLSLMAMRELQKEHEIAR